jgi:hypothetical protein
MSRAFWLLGLALGCTPELQPVRWQPIDIEALRDAIAHPTGIVDEASANEVAAAIVASHEARRVLAEFLHLVFVDSELRAGAPPWVESQALAGTSVYVLVACPGPLAGDAAPFTHGSMRVDAPILDVDVISTLAIPGQLHASLVGCEIADYVFEGVARAFHDSEPGELAMVPELRSWSMRWPDEVHELREPMLATHERVSALFELSSGETLVLDWYATQIELHLRGRNGEMICTIVGGSLDCVPP